MRPRLAHLFEMSQSPLPSYVVDPDPPVPQHVCDRILFLQPNVLTKTNVNFWVGEIRVSK
jgi:hypothetical protein